MGKSGAHGVVHIPDEENPHHKLEKVAGDYAHQISDLVATPDALGQNPATGSELARSFGYEGDYAGDIDTMNKQYDEKVKENAMRQYEDWLVDEYFPELEKINPRNNPQYDSDALLKLNRMRKRARNFLEIPLSKSLDISSRARERYNQKHGTDL